MTNSRRLGRYSYANNGNRECHSDFDQLESFCKDVSWDKPLFSRGRTSLEKVLAHARKTAEKSRRFINKIESKKQSSISRAKLIPENATIRKEYVKCGKTPCYHGKHGPYYYAYWKDPETKKLKKKYIGQYLQPSSKGKKQASTNDMAQVT